MRACELELTLPGDTPGIAEYRRSFDVQGTIRADGPLPDDCLLTAELLDAAGNCVRRVRCGRKNKPFPLYVPGLTAYDEALDPGRKQLEAFGFPELAAEDPAQPEKTMHCAAVKAWYSDTCFKAVITSATDPAHGAMMDDGMNLRAPDGSAYDALPMGDYLLRVRLEKPGELAAQAEKKVIVRRQEKQIICRFNPLSHKRKMTAWCREMGFSIISDLLPGYLDSYLGTWYYHMGLLKMYRANDIALFETAAAHMFVYLIDESSTSYATELAFLQEQGRLAETGRFTAYRYDIGEASVGEGRSFCREGKIEPFGPDEYLHPARIDLVGEDARDGRYALDGSGIEDIRTDFSAMELPSGRRAAFAGVIRPWQMDPADFIRRDDNTYEIKNAPAVIRYSLRAGGRTKVLERPVGLERLEGGRSIGGSVFEFYHCFEVPAELAGRTVTVRAEVLDRRGGSTPAAAEFQVRII